MSFDFEENDGVSTPPVLKSLIFGRDNAIVSTISNVVEAAKGLIGRIKSNFQQGDSIRITQRRINIYTRENTNFCIS